MSDADVASQSPLPIEVSATATYGPLRAGVDVTVYVQRNLAVCMHCGEALPDNPTDCKCSVCGFLNCDRP